MNTARIPKDMLDMPDNQVGVFKRPHKGIQMPPETPSSRQLESQVALEVLSDLTHNLLERQLADEEIG